MDIDGISAEVALDERVATTTVYKKDGSPFLAANGSESTVSFVGSESKRYRAAKDASQRKMLRSRMVKLEPKDLRDGRIELAASAITDWYGWESNGAPWPCTPENVKAWLRSSENILEQMEQNISGHADFFTRNSSS